MFTAQIKNKDNQTLTLTQNETDYQILSIIGLTPPKAVINTSPIAGTDGAAFGSARIDSRNIVITIRINGNVEANRHTLYNYFKVKENCTFYFQNDNLNAFAVGYIDAFECDLFSNSETAQISIICPNAYFQSVATHTASTVGQTGNITLTNGGDSETGVNITVSVSAAISSFSIKNTRTSEGLTFEKEFQSGDVINISTVVREKKATLTRSGVTTPLFSAMSADSEFFQILSGNNAIEIKADNGAYSSKLNASFSFREAYRGL